MPSTDVVGYTYRADHYCPGCILEIMAQNAHPVAPGEVDESDPALVEGILTELAEIAGVDRGDEHTFDSSDFPKVVLRYMAEEEPSTCGECRSDLLNS